jgi:hypothetical protein
MYRKCTVNLVPRRVLGPPDATVVGGGLKEGSKTQKNPGIIRYTEVFKLVAGAGFEPTTFRL